MEGTKIQAIGYTLLVTQFEQQLIITATSGQSGDIAIKITQTAIDGGQQSWGKVGIREIAHVNYGELREAAAPAWLETQLRKANLFDIDVTKVVKKFTKMWLPQ